MKNLKIGRKEYEVKPGDYIMDNGACYQFCSGDGRELAGKGFVSFKNLVMSNKLAQQEIKTLPLTYRTSSMTGTKLKIYTYQ